MRNAATRTRTLRAAVAALATLLALSPMSTAMAQEPFRPDGPGGQRGPGQRGPVGIDGSQALGRYFYSPMQVLRQAEEIGLTSEQESAVQELVDLHQASFRQLRFDLQNHMTRLAALAVDHPVEETAIMEQLETVLGLEAEIKRLQLVMLVQVKNLLTPDQQAQLRTGGPGQGPGPGPGPGRGPGAGQGAGPAPR